MATDEGGNTTVHVSITDVSTGSALEGVSITVKETRRHEPNPENKEVYDKTYETYLELYKSLAHMMTK